MKAGWKRVTVGSLLDVHYGKDHKKLGDGEIPVYGSAGVMRYAEKPLSLTPSILIPRKGTLNNVMYSTKPFWAVDTMFWCTLKNQNVVDFKFLYYWLSRVDFLSLNVGSAVPSTTVPTIQSLGIDLPPLPVQRRIAAVLGALDDKIELNRKMNANLEAQAQALFKSWFVDFEPWGGKMPKEWKMGTLGELVTVCYGKDHKKLADGAIPVFGSGGLMRYAEKALFDQESVLIPRKGSLNNIMYADKPFWTVDTMFYTKMKMKNAAKYVYLFLHGKDMSSLNTGSAVPSMTTDILNAMKVIVPSENGLSEFECKLNPMFKMIAANAAESRKLAETRDALLPKLMSGEVEA